MRSKFDSRKAHRCREIKVLPPPRLCTQEQVNKVNQAIEQMAEQVPETEVIHLGVVQDSPIEDSDHQAVWGVHVGYHPHHLVQPGHADEATNYNSYIYNGPYIGDISKTQFGAIFFFHNTPCFARVGRGCVEKGNFVFAKG